MVCILAPHHTMPQPQEWIAQFACASPCSQPREAFTGFADSALCRPTAGGERTCSIIVQRGMYTIRELRGGFSGIRRLP
jgi:hypothetical protein